MAFIVQRVEKKLFLDEWLAKTRIFAQSVTKIIQDGMEKKRPDIIRKVIHDLQKIEGIKTLQVVRNNGTEAFEDFETFYEVQQQFDLPQEIIDAYMDIEEGKSKIIHDEKIALVFKEEKEKEFYGYDEKGKIFYNYYLPIFNKRACHKCHGSEKRLRGILKISLYENKFTEHLNTHFYIFVGFLSLAIIILVSIIYWIINRIVSNPLDNVVRTIKAIDHGNLRQRIRLNTKDEIGFMARHFNIMLDRLEQERHLASIGKLSSVLAHEIKSPLGGISGAIQVIDEEIPAGDPKKGIITEIVKEIGRLDQMVKKLLQFSREVEISPKKFNINALIMDSIKFLKNRYRESNINIKTDLDNEISDIFIDAEKIKQAFLNICINAIESMDEGGTLTIATSIDLPDNFVADKEDKGEYRYIRIVISDTGKGILAENMQNIFTPFFTTKLKGDGLGLPISLRIVEKHRGMIKVGSKPGKGSKFSMILPLWDKTIVDE